MAAPTTIRELLVKLGVVADTVVLQRFDKQLESAKDTMISAAKWASGLAAGLAGLFGVGAAAAVSAANHADALDAQARKLDITTDTLQEYRHVLSQAGLDAQGVDKAFSRLAKVQADVAAGSEGMTRALRALGVSARDLRGKKLDEVFEVLADGAAKARDPIERLQALSQVFGEELVQKIEPALAGGAAGVRALREQARAYGLVMSKETIERNKAATGQFQLLRNVVASLRLEIGSALLPVLLSMVNRMLEWLRVNREAISMRIEQAVIAIGDAFKWVEGKVEDLNEVVEERFGGWKNLLLQVGKAVVFIGSLRGLWLLAKGALAVKAAVGAMGAAIAAVGWPVTLAIGGAILLFTGLSLAVDDFLAFMRGGKSVIGAFLAQFGVEEEVRNDFLEFFRAIQELFEAVKIGGRELAGVFKTALQPAFEAINPVLEKVLELVRELLKAIGVGMLENFRERIQEMTGGIRSLSKFLSGEERTSQRALEGAAVLLDNPLTNMTAGGWVLGALADQLRSTAAAQGVSQHNMNVSQNFEGHTIHAPGMDPQALAEELERRDAARRRQAWSFVDGGAR